jgi:hypothetical protein
MFILRINNKNIILIWLIIFFACSLPIVKRRRLPEIYSLPQLIPLNSDERTMIDSTFIQSGDRGEIAKYPRNWYKFKVHPLLKKIFPTTHFYRFYSGTTLPETPYTMAYQSSKFYNLPLGFNYLLFENKLNVTEKNKIELAKVFAVIAFMDDPYIRYWEGEKYKISECKEITFLEEKSINMRVGSAGIYNAFVKVKIDEEIQEWYFRTGYGGQFWGIDVGYPKTKQFYLKYRPTPAENK